MSEPAMSETNTNPEARVVEAVARAMCKRAAADAFGYEHPHTSPDEGWENYVTLARAAISAHTKALAAEGVVIVPREPTREMLNAAVDVDSFRLGDISPLGFRCSPQQLFESCYEAMLEAALPPPTLPPAGDET